jgi:all-trans-8'-apo-beta-carotenal 15,15'-oxygenase
LTWTELNPFLRDFRTAEDGLYFGGCLTRLRVSRSGRVTMEELSALPGEFPQYDWRRTGRPHRYGYLAVRSAGIAPNAVLKVDHETGAERRHELPEGHAVSEPIFVPRNEDAAEDDGWLLAVAYAPMEHRSRLLVLDARDPEADPLCVAHLRHHVPQSFHGTFTRRVARPGRPLRG